MNFLITRPEHEDTVFYLSTWSQELIDHAKQKDLNVLDCKGPKANKKTIETMLTKKKPILVTFNGHGSPRTLCGHKDEILIEKDKNEQTLANTIVFARSCQSAVSLGPSTIKHKTKAFIGYEDDFAFWIDNTKSATPLQDEFAKPFFKASNQVVHSLLSGNTVEESNKRSKAVFDHEIKKFLRSDAPPEAQYILPLLFWDKLNQVALGNTKTKI